MIPPSPPPEAPEPAIETAPPPTTNEPTDGAREGSQLFHAALVFGLIPGVSVLLALVGWMRLRAEEPRWALRLAGLGALDVLVFVALGIATAMTAAQLGQGGLLAPMGTPPSTSTTGAPAPLDASLAPRPRIGVVVDEHVRVITVAPGSPAA
ncbi:MAG: hypothetical protein J0L92_38840, partial [Deltaproteobacteria bacterium]|nr:hypothetical protein [Deltaproteobacteria bacterium]